MEVALAVTEASRSAICKGVIEVDLPVIEA